MSEIPAGTRALVVDDDDAVRLLLRMILERDGWTVLAARDAQEAIAQSTVEGRVRLLVSDVLLPGTSGRELHAMLRRSRPDLPALFLSGDSRESLVAREVLAPESEFLPKPFTPAELARRARAVAGLE